ncbi:MAG: hypothetical protein NC206_10525 [Bacteroides sp.]|nr:hypothetical protein [Roseburia sp.]MCM1347502.1 hypothetical protein [Bacteroides sp.]MCM1421637.1 hypothetical protein [Bacteroides sp.]
MKKYKFVLPVMLLAMVCMSAFAGNKAENAGKETSNKVYIFGVGTSLTDSIVYMSEIAELDNFPLEKTTNFLPYRSEFSIQLKQHLEGQLGLMNQTCCVFFSKEKKKISKKYYKIKKRYLDKMEVKLIIIGSDEFRFEKPETGHATEN